VAREVAKRLITNIRDHNLTLISGGIAFFALLSAIPALAATVLLYGLVAEPADITSSVDDLGQAIPPEARKLLIDQLNGLAHANHAGLGAGLVVSLVIALWSASAAMKHLLVALTVASGGHEQRSYVRLRGLAALLTVGGLVFITAVLAAVTAGPALTQHVMDDHTVATVVSILRWPVVALLMVLALAVLYHYAPDRTGAVDKRGGWRWWSWGAALATASWLVVSALFSLYVSHFSSYNKVYGSLAAVVVFMLWLYLSTLCVLLGAEINAILGLTPDRAA
jgi:membrane protein